MRLLFLLIWRNNFTLFFILLQALCIFLLLRNNRFQQASAFNATNSIVTSTMETVNGVREYIHLKDNNRELAIENARLRSEMTSSLYVSDSGWNNVSDTLTFQQYSFLQARVVNNSINKRNNYITLDKGSLHGIEPEMGVITDNGVIGIVQQVSPHYSTVISLLNEKSNISAMIKRNKFFGSLRWDGTNPSFATLYEIDKTVPIQKGDSVITTAFSAIFPAGIFIGKVEDIAVEAGSPFYKIRVKLDAQFGRITHVYVVRNLLKEEQRALETGSTTNTRQP
jgi:rod shape-determining protein MreC